MEKRKKALALQEQRRMALIALHPPERGRPGEKPLCFVPEADSAYTVAPYYALQEERFTCFPMFAQTEKA